ncbi:NAD(P)/FAD-dependent oxidoreductase [Pseudoroseicyclus tamaricis]|uniref:Thioredoxin reductase n=1 Tax=Pseudoroseicyclus tamaricis TaxID=2705421 RepID=A0A6B2JJH3_9RHOB|nr:NAD(P)/FAD-dependent oxidoreductase [Pseudoroseicyclus tamaricis]NDV01591.1 NAD(P)/FAD-dependent oxidoreductase [Pseudoroseicyclus tamaricis]
MPSPAPADVLIIGGSYAGLSAALQLLRPGRRVTIIDAGQRRNRFAAHAHNLIGFDGVPPGEIAARARADVMAYPTLTWVEGLAESVSRGPEGFTATLTDGSRQSGAQLILATGVADELPGTPGLAPLWGSHVFHCPYCHGTELGGRRAAVLASAPVSRHQAQMVRDWGPVTYLANGADPLDEATLADFAARDVAIETAPVTSVAAAGADIETRLADGRALTFAGLFIAPAQRPASPIAAQLGCDTEETPFGSGLRVGPMQETSVPGVFACGDLAAGPQSLAAAIGRGQMAGAGAHRALLFP